MLKRDQDKINLIIFLRLEGLSYSQIGTKLNLSRQRIQQLIRPPKKIISLVSERANYHCELCGIPLLKSGHIHHKQSKDMEFNDTNNLQLLCISCHRSVHFFPPNTPKMKENIEGKKAVKKLKRTTITMNEYLTRKPQEPIIVNIPFSHR